MNLPLKPFVDEGMATSLTTVTLNKSTYAFFFNPRGSWAVSACKDPKSQGSIHDDD